MNMTFIVAVNAKVKTLMRRALRKEDDFPICLRYMKEEKPQDFNDTYITFNEQ